MPDQTFQITTPRLTISHLIAENDTHCDFIVNLYNTPEFLASTGGNPANIIVTREAARQLITERFYGEHARNGYGTYLFSLKPNAGNGDSIPIGTTALSLREEPNRYTAPDLGFAILSKYMRKGYTKEAAAGLMEWAEKEKGVKDILGFHDPGNLASAAVFESLGFEDRGLVEFKDFGKVGRVWTRPGMARDLSVYGLPPSGAGD